VFLLLEKDTARLLGTWICGKAKVERRYGIEHDVGKVQMARVVALDRVFERSLHSYRVMRGLEH
jgi:hypothetical protein